MVQRSEELADYTETLYRRLKKLEDAARAVVEWWGDENCLIDYYKRQVGEAAMDALAAALARATHSNPVGNGEGSQGKG